MSSFWRNDDKIKVSQTQVSVPSTNGLSYSSTAGQSGRRVDFEIPSTVKFLDGKNSYLQFDIKIGLPAGSSPTRLQLDPFIGGQSVVKNLRIYSGNRSVLLEEISDYNAKVQMQYSYNQDDSMRKLRALKEGSLINTVENRGTLGTSVSNNIDLSSNPYYKPVGTVPATRDWGTTDDFLTAKLSLPIHCGMFADGGNKIFPVLMTDGLFVEVDLEDPARYLKQLDSVNRNRRMKQNPIFHGVDKDGLALSINNATNRTEIYLGLQNNMRTVENCPFVKGERIGICKIDDPLTECALTLTATGAQGHPKIDNIEVADGYVRITCEQFQNSNTGTGVEATSNNFIIFSATLDTKRVQVGDLTTQIIAASTSYAATTEISNCAIVCQQVGLDPQYEAGMMKRMRDGGSIEIDIPSVTNYKHSLLKSNRNATINLAVSNTRAKSMIVMPTDATVLSPPALMAGTQETYEEE